jgi:hypothetical protein
MLVTSVGVFALFEGDTTFNYMVQMIPFYNTLGLVTMID